MRDYVKPGGFGWSVPLPKPAILLLVRILRTVASLRLRALLLSSTRYMAKGGLRSRRKTVPVHAVKKNEHLMVPNILTDALLDLVSRHSSIAIFFKLTVPLGTGTHCIATCSLCSSWSPGRLITRYAGYARERLHCVRAQLCVYWHDIRSRSVEFESLLHHRQTRSKMHGRYAKFAVSGGCR